jgi:hypothetical protein
MSNLVLTDSQRVTPAAAAAVAQVTRVIDNLKQLLDEVTTRRADRGEQLRLLLTGIEQAVNAAQAAQASVMVAMGHEARTRDAAAPFDPTNLHSHEEFVPDEIATLLHTTVVSASHRYATALNAQRREATTGAWRSGAIDERKVAVIEEQLQHLESPEAADHLADLATQYAAEHTAPQTRRWLARQVIEADPEAADRRRTAAVDERRVVVTPRDDGTAELWALLPGIAARQIQQTLTAMAQQCGVRDDPRRTMDQRRADVLVDLVLGTQTPAVVPMPVLVPVTSDGWTAEAPFPAELPGWGPLTPGELDKLLSSAAPEPGYRPSSALDSAVRMRDLTCRFPGCRRSALGAHSGADVDHTVPWPAGTTSPDNLAVLCRRHHRLKHEGGWSVTLSADGSMRWTSPLGAVHTTQVGAVDDRSPPDEG